MMTLREFRKVARLSQSAMADLLKTTRSQVAMAELGKRAIPPHAAKRLDGLLGFSKEAGRMPIEEQLALIESEQMLGYEAKSIWEGMLARNNYEQYKVRLRLKNMQEVFESALNSSRTFWSAVETLSTNGGAAPELNYFKDKQKSIQRKLLTCGKIAQLQLQLSIDLLVAEASLLNQYLHPTTVEKEKPM